MKLEIPSIMFSKENKKRFIADLKGKIGTPIIDNFKTEKMSITGGAYEIEKALRTLKKYRK